MKKPKQLRTSQVDARAMFGERWRRIAGARSEDTIEVYASEVDTQLIWSAGVGRGQSIYSLSLEDEDLDIFLSVLAQRPGAAVKMSRAVANFIAAGEREASKAESTRQDAS